MKLALLSGAHVHTPGYLKTIRERDDLELAVVWDDMPSRGQEIAESMGCPFQADLAQALATAGLDIAVICADNASHRPLVEAAAAAGLDIFCEKPLALTVADADAMLAAVQSSGVKCVIGFFQPYPGAAIAARRFLAEGGLGELTHVGYRNAHHAAYGHWFDSPSHQWFVDKSKSGGGAFCDMGAHAMHFARLFFGPVSTVMADISNKSAEYPTVDDHGVALLQFASGATGILVASWVHTGGPGGLEVVGSKGRLRLEGNTCRVTPFIDGRGGETYELTPADGQSSSLQRLFDLRDGKLDADEAAYDLLCARDAVAISVAAYESAATGQRVAVA
ncbi:MAG: Gfo/Idh/MocA family oxidoreductase [Armatimonadetes bacterium]|nr:Gfo/Idh/MocA family oxidoreductase [Armatimonadota bacterium]